MDPAQADFVDIELVPTLSQLLDGDPALHAGQRGAQAAVNTVAETERDTGLALDVERVGIIEGAGVAGGRAGQQQDRPTGLDGPALELPILGGIAALVLRRWQV